MVLKGVLLLLLVVAVNAKSSYLVKAPKWITLGQDYTVTVHILKAPRPVTVEISILQRHYVRYRSYVKTPIVSIRKVCEQGNQRSVTLKVPQVVKTGSYILKVKGSGGLIFEREETLSRNYKSISAFVQTDKGVYKPGQTVRFRTLCFDRNLKIYNGSVSVTVFDPHHNRIKQWRSVSSESGVNERELQLSEQTPLGRWRIELSVPQFTSVRKYAYFEVDQYELPKIEVQVKLPPFALITDRNLSGTITAKYTFGKGVKGTVSLRVFVGSLNSYGYCGRVTPARSVHKAYEIDGSVDFSVPVADIKRIRYSLYHQSITVLAEVTEELTGKAFNGSSQVKYYPQPYKISFMDSSSNTFKPGLPYRAYVKVSEQDDRPVNNGRVKVYTCARYEIRTNDQQYYECGTFTGTYGLPQLDLAIGDDGVVQVDLDIPENATEVKMRAYYGSQRASRTVYQRQSPSKTFIQIRLGKMDLKAGDKVPVEIQGTSELTEVSYQISARGAVIASDVAKHSNASNPNIVKFDMKVLHAMSPTANLLAYYVTKTGEIVADSTNFNVEGVFENEVSIDFSEEEAEPRDNVTVNVKADVNSTAFLLAVDQSVQLLDDGNDITARKVMDDLRGYAPSSPRLNYVYWRYPIPASGQNAQQILQNAQTVMITDGLIYTGVRRTYYDYGRYNRYPNYNYHNYNDYHGYGPQYMYPTTRGPYAMYAVGNSAYRQYEAAPAMAMNAVQLKEVEFVRHIFPETWLWKSVSISSESGERLPVKVPDTITSWVLNSFAVNPNSGLGVAATTAKLRTFRPFFVTLKLPLSVVKGEVVFVQANIFNYLGSDIKVKVQLKPNAGFTSDEGPQWLAVQNNETKAVYFSVTPKAVGKVDIEISAQSTVASDAVKRQLTVKPEGIRKETNIPTLIHLTPQSTTYRRRMTLYIPRSIVPDSLSIRLSVTGDIFGPTIGNLEDLLALPTGCGEQTLLKFAPNIYISDYLTVTNQLTPQLEAKIKAYLGFGYQRLLYYQRYDRSFSPFGERDEAGSVWLTSFIMKVLYQASPYIDIDMRTIDYAVNWITSKQSGDGGFVEPGRVIDRQLQGRNGDGPGLTAYVTAALLETSGRNGSGVSEYRFQNAIRKAVTYLESQPFEKMNLHDLSITTYALSKASSVVSREAMSVLLSKATKKRGSMFWDVNPGSSRVQSIDIMTSSYALLALVKTKNFTEGMDIMRWLVSQKSARGGFRSSQDTTLALEALTKFLAGVQPDNYNVSVKVTVDKAYEKTINKDNALVVHSFEIPPSRRTRYIRIEASGQGMAIVEVSTMYNIRYTRNNVFDFNTVMLDETVNDFTVMMCTRHLYGGSSGMVVASIQIPSGFAADPSSGKNVAGVRRLKQEGENIVVYYDKIGTSSTCFPLSCSRTSLVMRNKRTYISILDYYNTLDNTGTVKWYYSRKLTYAKKCEVCENCKGCNNQ